MTATNVLDRKHFEEALEKKAKILLLVCGTLGFDLEITGQLLQLKTKMIPFMDFTPNPTYESIKKGVKVFCKKRCDGILAVGGGSTIDVAKCIKLFATMKHERDYLEQEAKENGIPLFVVPTTAGTGSEATKFAVMYKNGEKQSVCHESLIPTYVLLETGTLLTLPLYQRKATMLDALCHAIEACWSIHSTKQSRMYSKQSVMEILKYSDGYLSNTSEGNTGMMYAAHTAGRAINITRTTAAHAMCYKLTSLYKVAHGHAAALCLVPLWRYMINHMEECRDTRGADFVWNNFQQIANLLGCKTPPEAVIYLENRLREWDLAMQDEVTTHLQLLVRSVNLERLQNNPITLSKTAIEQIYRDILTDVEGKRHEDN